MPDTLTQVLSLLDKSPDVNAQVAYKELCKAVKDGTVLELPKPLTPIWLLLEKCDDGYEILKSYISHYHITPGSSTVSAWIDCQEIGYTLEYPIDAFGRDIFLTESAAHDALERK